MSHGVAFPEVDIDDLMVKAVSCVILMTKGESTKIEVIDHDAFSVLADVLYERGELDPTIDAVIVGGVIHLGEGLRTYLVNDWIFRRAGLFNSADTGASRQVSRDGQFALEITVGGRWVRAA